MATKERKEYEDGSVYEGELRDAKRNGKGTFAWATGDRLVTYPLSNPSCIVNRNRQPASIASYS